MNKNPDYELPKGFKKISQQSISFEYYIPDNFQFGEADRICYEIIGDMLDEVAGIAILEPISRVSMTYRIK